MAVCDCDGRALGASDGRGAGRCSTTFGSERRPRPAAEVGRRTFRLGALVLVRHCILAYALVEAVHGAWNCPPDWFPSGGRRHNVVPLEVGRTVRPR